MGYRLLAWRPSLAAETTFTASGSDLSRSQAYRSGLTTAVSNPAAALYFLSVFTTFIPTASTVADKILAGLTMLTITLTWYSLVALTFSNARVRGLYHRVEVGMNRVFGVLWLLLAVKLLFT
jgi:threonine/homoserine/homoserine lactone efflux protein